MARIYDFNNFSSSSGSREDYEFRYELDFTDTTVVNPPEELKNLDTASVNVTYKSSVKIDKNGIYDIDFSISEMEIRFEMDDYPNESIIEEIELKPGVNIPEDQIKITKGDYLIPTYPSSITIDMKKVNDSGKFYIEITFGKD
jgi:hypothetical protein